MSNLEKEPTRGPTDVERRLRAALEARTEMIGAADLRPAVAPWSPSQRVRRRPVSPYRWIIAGATAMTVAVGGAWLVMDSDRGGRQPPVAHGAGPSASASPTQPAVEATAPPVVGAGPGLSVEFGSASGAISGTAGRVTRPVAKVAGGSPEAAERARVALDGRIAHLVATVRAQLPTVEQLRLDISVGEVMSWGRYLSVRFDVRVDPGDGSPLGRSSAVVLDTESGDAVAATRLFPNVDEIDRMMRAAIVKVAGPAVRDSAVAELSMRPGRDGTTGPLAWYPAPDGLHWVVDQCAVAACAAGKPAAVLPWARVDN